MTIHDGGAWVDRIICGDCLEVMPNIPDASIDMILADLPYGTTACHWDSIIPLEPLWAQYKRIIKPRGAIVLTASEPFNYTLFNSNPSQFKYDLIWDKNIATGGQNAKFRPMKSHEIIMIFSDGVTVYNPQMEKLTQSELKRIRKKDYNLNIGEAFGKSKMITKSRSKVIAEGGVKYPRSIIRINGVHSCSSQKKDGLHPTQKPVALFSYLICTYTNPGDIVLDNVAGSGTTAIAAIETGRNWLCIEKDAEYYRIAKDRIEQRLKQPFLPELQPARNGHKPKQLELIKG